MAGDELSIELFLWGTAFAFGLAAVTMAGSERIWIIRVLWSAAVAFLAAALLWPFADRWPAFKGMVESLSLNHIALNILGLSIFSLLIFDYRLRTNRSPTVGRDVQSFDPKEINGQLQSLVTKIADVHETAEKTRKELDPLEKNTVRNNGKLHEIDSELPTVFEIIMEQLAHSLLFDGIPPEPELLPVSDLTPQNIKLEQAKAVEFWVAVRRVLSDTQWGMSLRGIEQHAEGAAEYFVREIPPAERPANIDPLDLRLYAIDRIRCQNTGFFLRSERAEAWTRYRPWLSRMKELLAARKSNS